MVKTVKVRQDEFDANLRKLLQAAPLPLSEIKGRKQPCAKTARRPVRKQK